METFTRYRAPLLWLIFLFFLSIVSLVLVDLFTFKPRPGGHLSGNGNPALFFIFILVPIYLAFIALAGTLVHTFFRHAFRQGKHSVEWIILLICIGCLLGWLSKVHANEIYATLGGKPGNPHSLLAGWSMFNQYTNTVYFNYITYSLGMLAAIVAAYFTALVRHLYSHRKQTVI